MKKDDIFKYIAYAIGIYILYLFAINITTKSQYVKCEGKLYNTFYLNETGIQEGGKDLKLKRSFPDALRFLQTFFVLTFVMC